MKIFNEKIILKKIFSTFKSHNEFTVNIILLLVSCEYKTAKSCGLFNNNFLLQFLLTQKKKKQNKN